MTALIVSAIILILIVAVIVLLLVMRNKKKAEEAISDLKRMMDEKTNPTPGAPTPTGPTQKDFQDLMAKIKARQDGQGQGRSGAWWWRKREK